MSQSVWCYTVGRGKLRIQDLDVAGLYLGSKKCHEHQIMPVIMPVIINTRWYLQTFITEVNNLYDQLLRSGHKLYGLYYGPTGHILISYWHHWLSVLTSTGISQYQLHTHTTFSFFISIYLAQFRLPSPPF